MNQELIRGAWRMTAGALLMAIARQTGNEGWKAEAAWDLRSGRTLLHYGEQRRYREWLMRRSLAKNGDVSLLT